MNTFPKREHLFGDKAIEKLHTTGSSFLVYPFRVVYLNISNSGEQIPVRVMIGVSKKKFKKAVNRNRLKRLMREAYRLNKTELINFATENKLTLHIGFQYIANEILSIEDVNIKMLKALDKLTKIISANSKKTDENG